MQKKRFRIHLNIGTLIFGILFVYLCITLILFATKRHVDTYQVISGPLSGNDTYTAMIMRNEEVVKSSVDGYVNFFINDASKISKSDLICCVSPSELPTSNITIDSTDTQTLRTLSSAASKTFDRIRFDDIYDLQYSISNVLWDAAAMNSAAGNFYVSYQDGIVSTYVDGCEYVTEDELTTDMGQNSGYLCTRLSNQQRVQIGTDLYRMISGEEWYIYFPITDAQTVRLASLPSIKVKFLSDNNTESGKLSFYTNGDQRFAKVTLHSGLLRYVDERYIDVEIISNVQTGLKIPTSAIVTKDFYTVPASFLTYSGENDEAGFLRETRRDDGSKTTSFVEATVYAKITPDDGSEDLYYVDTSVFSAGDILVRPDSDTKYTINNTGTLEGVYCVNKGYSVFRKISIIDQNSDFCIVEEGTSYGLSLYDFIVRDGSTVKEEDIIY